MISKLPILGFALVTGLSGQALAHDRNGPTRAHPNAAYKGPTRTAPTYSAPPAYRSAAVSGSPAVAFRSADRNHDGWVSLYEALDHGRDVFQRNDADRNGVLAPYEITRHQGIARRDLNRDGWVTYGELETGLRYDFAALDGNRDGWLARYEIGGQPAYRPSGDGYWR